jgi:hypothetical protein
MCVWAASGALCTLGFTSTVSTSQQVYAVGKHTASVVVLSLSETPRTNPAILF